MTTPIQSQTLVELAIAQLTGSRKFLLGLIETLEDSQLTTRVGGVGNHALWVLGHIAFADDLFVSEFRGEASSLPEGHAKQFGQGSIPSERASDYPSRDEMLEQLGNARTRLIEWVKSLEGDAAWQEAPESIKPLTPNAIDAAFSLAQHEFLHAGQLTTVRSSLGMKPLFGIEGKKSTTSYTRDIIVSSTPGAAYQALTSGFDKWWTPGSNSLTAVGDTITFRFEHTYWVMRANCLNPDYIELECLEAHHVHDGLPSSILKEWEGTKLKWKIQTQDRNTKISLTHEGLIPSLGCYEVCEAGWDHFFVSSLKAYLDGGNGSAHEAGECSSCPTSLVA